VIGALRPPAERPCITITATIGVTALWLLPRLGAFQRSAPDIDVRVAATNRVMDLERDGMDLACASARTRWRRRGDTPVQRGAGPVAHPSLGVTAIEDAAQLRRHVLIDYDDSSRPWLQWKNWLRDAGHKTGARRECPAALQPVRPGGAGGAGGTRRGARPLALVGSCWPRASWRSPPAGRR
jgi:LysR family glycine cleavage system transcriptional activator